MTNSYYIDNNLFIQNMLPSYKNTPIHLAWLEDLNYDNNWINQNLNEYIFGSTYSIWTSSVTYSVGIRVNGGLTYNNYIYEAQAINYNVPVTNTASWYPVDNNFIGMSERSLYTGNKMILEWALNRWFDTTYRQNMGVTSWNGTLPDIYIQDTTRNYDTFHMGPTSSACSTMAPTSSSAFMSPGGFLSG